MMKVKDAFLKVLIKMAMADEKLLVEELNMIRHMKDELQMDDVEMNALIRAAKEEPIEDLVNQIVTYEDRLFTVQHAYYMALADQELDVNESELISYLSKTFGISAEDISRIEKSAELIKQGQYAMLTDPSVIYLHNNFFQSSFAENWETEQK